MLNPVRVFLQLSVKYAPVSRFLLAYSFFPRFRANISIAIDKFKGFTSIIQARVLLGICVHLIDRESWIPPSTRFYTPHSLIVVVHAAIDEEICLQVTVTRYIGTFSSLSTPNK